MPSTGESVYAPDIDGHAGRGEGGVGAQPCARLGACSEAAPVLAVLAAAVAETVAVAVPSTDTMAMEHLEANYRAVLATPSRTRTGSARAAQQNAARRPSTFLRGRCCPVSQGNPARARVPHGIVVPCARGFTIIA